MTRRRGELPEPEEQILGIERLSADQEAEVERIHKEKAELRKMVLRSMLENEHVRAWLMEMITGFGTFENSFGAGPTGFPDHDATQFKMGMKAAGWHLWSQFDDSFPDLASLMRREANQPKG